jgi:hypothetical protein
MVSRVKTNWEVDTGRLRKVFRAVLKHAETLMAENDLPPEGFEAMLLQEDRPKPKQEFDLSEEEAQLLPTGFLSQRPLVRLLMLRREIEQHCQGLPAEIQEFFLVTLGHVIANGAGNFAFGPEIYRTKPKPDYDVLGHFARQGDLMIREMETMRLAACPRTACTVLEADARMLSEVPGEISAVITSPPYPNEKDYTRTTRVESILLRLVTNKMSLRGIKESLLRSNTRNVFVGDQDGLEVAEFDSIQAICRAIEARRIELGKNSGFERLYHKVVAHYFGGMRRHLRALYPKLRRKARLAYVVGDQLSFLMVPIATARLLSEVAAAEGYVTAGCNLWRERIGTKIRNSTTNERIVRVREEILLLQKP